MTFRVKNPIQGRCVAGVWNLHRHHQCENRASIDDWCGMHHPDKVKARRDAVDAKWRKKQADIKAARDAHRLHDQQAMRAWAYLFVWLTATYVDWAGTGSNTAAEDSRP